MYLSSLIPRAALKLALAFLTSSLILNRVKATPMKNFRNWRGRTRILGWACTAANAGVSCRGQYIPRNRRERYSRRSCWGPSRCCNIENQWIPHSPQCVPRSVCGRRQWKVEGRLIFDYTVWDERYLVQFFTDAKSETEVAHCRHRLNLLFEDLPEKILGLKFLDELVVAPVGVDTVR